MCCVLIVDDEKSIRITLSEFLRKEGYEADAAPDAEIALQMLEEKDYDVIVTDIVMPRLSGVEFLTKVREKWESVQIIIMTGEPTVETAVKAVKRGANDYLTKPISRDVLLKAVSHAEQIKKLHDEKIALEIQNQRYQSELEATVSERTIALQNTLQGIISLLSSVVEARDPYTAGHQRRVGNLSAAIANKMNLGSQIAELVRIIGYIHDIGKIAIPTEILSRPGVLNSLEMQMIKNHPLSGYEMLTNVNLPPLIGETIYQHQERCNGSGYPRGLKCHDITIEAKIIMVADVVEAMMSHRPYRPALGLEAAMREIRQNAGILYDGDVVAACTELLNEDHYTVDDSEHTLSFPL